MNETFVTLLILVFTMAGSLRVLAADGAVSGRVVITKAMTKRRVTLPAYDVRGVPVNTVTPAQGAGSDATIDELARVIVYLEGLGLKPAPPTTSTLTQKGRHFDPDMVVVPVGSTVSFPNNDPIFHNVFSLSKTKQFDLGYYPAGRTRSVKFDKPGIVQVFCHIHPDMSAAIVVVPNVDWAHPQKGGEFAFSAVPPGNYDLIAWHRSAGFFRRRITVTEGGTTDENFVIPVKDLDSGASTKTGGSP